MNSPLLNYQNYLEVPKLLVSTFKYSKYLITLVLASTFNTYKNFLVHKVLTSTFRTYWNISTSSSKVLPSSALLGLWILHQKVTTYYQTIKTEKYRLFDLWTRSKPVMIKMKFLTISMLPILTRGSIKVISCFRISYHYFTHISHILSLLCLTSDWAYAQVLWWLLYDSDPTTLDLLIYYPRSKWNYDENSPSNS